MTVSERPVRLARKNLCDRTTACSGCGVGHGRHVRMFRMKSLPQADETLLIRTDFSDQEGWEALWTAVTTPNADDFLANVHLVDDPAYSDATVEQLAALAPVPSLIIVADKIAITSPEQPLLTI